MTPQSKILIKVTKKHSKPISVIAKVVDQLVIDSMQLSNPLHEPFHLSVHFLVLDGLHLYQNSHFALRFLLESQSFIHKSIHFQLPSTVRLLVLTLQVCDQPLQADHIIFQNVDRLTSCSSQTSQFLG